MAELESLSASPFPLPFPLTPAPPSTAASACLVASPARKRRGSRDDEKSSQPKRKKTQQKESIDPILEETLAQIAAFPNPSSQRALEDLINTHFLHLPTLQHEVENTNSFQQNQISVCVSPLSGPLPHEVDAYFDFSDFLVPPICEEERTTPFSMGLLDMTIAETNEFDEFEKSETEELAKKCGLLCDEGSGLQGFADADADESLDVNMVVDEEFLKKMDGILGLGDMEMGDNEDVEEEDVTGGEKEEGSKEEAEQNRMLEETKNENEEQEKGKEEGEKRREIEMEAGGIVLKWQKVESGAPKIRKNKSK